MPLSEHEQRQLEAIERQLYADDPKFASMRFVHPRSQGRRRIAVGIGVVIVGLIVLLVGAVASVWYVGVIGFLIMLLGATHGVSGIRRLKGGVPQAADRRDRPGRRRSAESRIPLVERLESRWRRRFDGS